VEHLEAYCHGFLAFDGCITCGIKPGGRTGVDVLSYYDCPGGYLLCASLWTTTALMDLYALLLFSGAPVVVSVTSARGRRDEAGPHLSSVWSVPQDLHSASRKRQVRKRLEREGE